MTTDEFLAEEMNRVPKRSTIIVASFKLLPWLEGFTAIPNEVVEAASEVLKKALKENSIRDWRIYPFGEDLHVQINTSGRGIQDQAIHRLAFEAALAGLNRARESRKYTPYRGVDLFALPPRERIIALNVRPLEFPFTERGSEPILVTKLINGAAGGFNRMLHNLFFHPDKGSHQRLDNTRFLAVVEHIHDLKYAKDERRLYAFGLPREETLHLIYPLQKAPMVINRASVGDEGEMLSLIADPSEWVISAIYALDGRMAFSKGKWQDTRYEPVALVSVEPALPGVALESPVVVMRLQSGSPALGEAHLNLGGDFHYTVGGPGGGYHVGVMPVTVEQARTACDSLDTARLAAYSYQSYDNGRIPPEHDVIDVYAQDTVQTEWLQDEAREFIHLMTQHGEFQPRLTAWEAERRATERADSLSRLFEDIPSIEKGETDPLILRANESAGGETLSDIKADAGGKVGHTTTVTLFEFAARASLREEQEKGLIRNAKVFPVGDDLHLLMSHSRGVDNNEVHLAAFRTFWRLVWVTEMLGYKPYGLAQDLKIGPATKGKRVDDLAEPSERFISLLAEELPLPERSYIDNIHAGWLKWQETGGGIEVKRPFAGNITGQGPGFAELPVRGIHRVGLVAGDKCGPAAFNIPVFHAVDEVLLHRQTLNLLGGSLAYEIYDVHNRRRIFLDARSHREDILILLGATNLFNVKRIWSLPQTISGRETVKEAVGDILMAASTEKLALIAGGEYVGKDDPVLLSVEELADPIFDLVKSGFYMTQGDERGSHYMMLVPKPIHESVATVRSRGFQVGLKVTLGQGIEELSDVYASPSYREARIRIDKANARIWRAQGSEFTPVGVGARDVEPAYPLMKVLNRITAKDSPYANAMRSGIRDLYEDMTRTIKTS